MEPGPATDPSPSEEATAAASAPPHVSAGQHRSLAGGERDHSPTTERPTPDVQVGQARRARTEPGPATNPFPHEKAMVAASAPFRADAAQSRSDKSDGRGRSPTAKRPLHDVQRHAASATAGALEVALVAPASTRAGGEERSCPSFHPRKMIKAAGPAPGDIPDLENAQA